MTALNQVTILGSGTSTGIPILGCKCAVCQSKDTRDRRLRTSIFIKSENNHKILVDTSPDLRSQLLRSEIDNIDSCIITHEHADHCHGIDDLRPINFLKNKSIPIFTSEHCANILKNKFDYIFNSKKPVIGGGVPDLSLQNVKLMNEQLIKNEKFFFFQLPHGHTTTLGFVHQERFAYLVDCKIIPQKVLEILKSLKLKLLIIDCVKPYPHATHLHYAKSIEYAQVINAERTRLIHMSHDFSHGQLVQSCKADCQIDIAPCADEEVYDY